jgi:phosphoglycerate dehydrogenase-like enzyme
VTTIACLSPFPESAVCELAGTTEVKVLLVPDPPASRAVAEAVAGTDIVIGDVRHQHRLDRDVLRNMTGCRLIQQPSVGFDAIDHRAAAEFGIPVANADGYNRESVADLAILGLLTLLRHAAHSDRILRAGGWRESTVDGRELGDCTVGIVGMGNIGTSVLTRLRAFGCRVLFHDIATRGVSGAEAVGLDELLERSDAVTVHVPLDRDTRGLLGPAELGRMKAGALLVNTSRGPVLDEAALIGALQAGHLGGAALDVFEDEPLATDSPLRALDNVFLTPHIGGHTSQARAKQRHAVATNLRRVLAREEPLNVVNGIRAGV